MELPAWVKGENVVAEGLAARVLVLVLEDGRAARVVPSDQTRSNALRSDEKRGRWTSGRTRGRR